MHTFLWHDYETFGADAHRDRPAQFGAVRTDADLQPIGEPLLLHCQPAPDYLPQPGACLVTGITPQQCLQEGLPEYQFAARIEAELSQPGTIGVGYNSIRFDDEITRFMFWRNLIEPYAREWSNQCGRWDLLDVMRMAYALRPEGIEWPLNTEGKPSFKLEHLTAANGIAHEAAHNALSDVHATLGLARLLRQKHPKLFDFALALHKKERVSKELGLPCTAQTARPFLHISGMFSAERGCLAVMWPLAQHPTIKNELIAWDLAHDPSELASLDAATIRQRLFTRAADLPESVQRLPLKTIHLNKSPMVVGNVNTLTAHNAERLGIDRAACERHWQIAQTLPDMSAIWADVFQRETQDNVDIDQALYSGGFIGHADRSQLNRLRMLSEKALADAHPNFEDARLPELFWRYRARNFPHTLSPEERERWENHRAAVLLEGQGGGMTLDALFGELDTLGEQADARTQAILEAIYDYAESIAPEV